jgi:general secretion pathway protein G
LVILRTQNQKGFTLIEMMIVLAIMSILATIATPNMQRYIVRAREASLRETLFVLRDVIDQHYSDQGKYPDSLEQLVERKYIRSIPLDPITGTSSTWIVTPPEGEEEGGVYDVHSGSDRVSLDGEPYNEW